MPERAAEHQPLLKLGLISQLGVGFPENDQLQGKQQQGKAE